MVNFLVTKNTLAILMSNSLSKGFLFLLSIFIARILTVEEFGFYTYVLVLGGIFFSIVDLGLTFFVIRETAKNPEKSDLLIANGLSSKIILSIIVIALGTLIGFFSEFSFQELFILMAIIISVILESIIVFLFSPLKAKQDFVSQSIVLSANNFIILILAGTALYLGFSFIGIGIAYIIASLLSTIFSIIFLKKNKVIISINPIKKGLWAIKKSFFFGALSFLGILFLYTDPLLIKLLMGDYSLGIYGVAAKFYILFTLVVSAFNEALFPLTSKNASDKKGFKRIIKKSLLFGFLFSIGISLIFYLFRTEIVLSVFGEKFFDSIELFIWFIPLLPITFLDQVTATALMSLRLEKILFRNRLIATIINIILSFILIIPFGIAGVLFGSTIALTILLALNSLKLKKIL
ncbi:MAG: hypothetical protein CL944_01915 [Candidatus Diapherotrites archaeon]|uniref:Uncharacterized protein n=1 Tax=Candidatus Iainarchaeum sp. TaxID=3101447 RepID=A0A2D6LPU2_9ARCH|nr:hypothetical protein [Candidatus Diapherotrites archaeon]|tara:strand:+ start:14404 stop:15621 length:1218 start_codon:yes stop_codon:yes gene_type:complete